MKRKLFEFHEPLLSEIDGKYLGDIRYRIPRSTILSKDYGFREYCDNQSKLHNKPLLTDEEVIEEFKTINYAYEIEES